MASEVEAISRNNRSFCAAIISFLFSCLHSDTVNCFRHVCSKISFQTRIVLIMSFSHSCYPNYIGTWSLTRGSRSFLIGSSVGQIAISSVVAQRPLLSDHLTEIPIGSSVSQIAISSVVAQRPLLSDLLTKIPIGSSVSQFLLVKLPVSDHLP